MQDYAVYLWTILLASIFAILLKLRQNRQRSNVSTGSPSLFESIQFMKNEYEVRQEEFRQRKSSSASSSSSRKRHKSSIWSQSVQNEQQQNVADLLATLGIKNEESLRQLMQAFRPINIGPNVKLHQLVNIEHHVIVVQNGEVKLSINDSNNFSMCKLVKPGGVIYSKLAVINYLLNFKSHPEAIPLLETTKPTTLLVLHFNVLKSLTNEEAITCSISQFIAEVQKIVIDAFFGELCIPLTAMFKYETVIDESKSNVARFLSDKLDFHDVTYLQRNLVKFNLKTKGEMLAINGLTHDIGLVLITSGSIEVNFTNRPDETKYVVTNSWYGFVSLLSSPTGTPFPKSCALTDQVEGYILKRSTFRDMCAKSHDYGPLKKAAKRIIKSLSPLVFKFYYSFNWITVPSGQRLYRQNDPTHGVFAVIRGKLKMQEQKNNLQEDNFFMLGVFDCILERPYKHSVIAARASELCFIPSELIRGLKNRYPTMQNRLVKALSEHLIQSWKSKKPVTKSSSKTRGERSLKIKGVAVFAATSEVQLSKLGTELSNSMNLLSLNVKKLSPRRVQEQVPSLSNLDPMNNPHLMAWLRDQQRAYEVLIYVCDMALTPWTKWCLSEADIIVDTCMASKGPFVSDFESEVFHYTGTHCEMCLVLLHSPETLLPRGTADWLYRRKPYLDTHYHVKLSPNEPVNLHSDIARVARHILGLDVGLVLGGGGARGAAHVGMLKAIKELGIPIDRVGGVSIGAMVGGLWATHRNLAKVKQLANEWFGMIAYEKLGHIWNMTYPLVSPFTGEFFNFSVKKTMGETVMIEDLWLPYYCCSTDISVIQSRIHTSGWLWRYCRASMSYCWVCPPICDPRDGHLLVDGCYTENVPGQAMKQLGVKYILALDIAAVDDRDLTNYGDCLSGTWAFLDKMKPFGKPRYKIPDQAEIQLRLAFCSHYRNLEELQIDPEVEYLCPDLGFYTSSDVRFAKPGICIR